MRSENKLMIFLTIETRRSISKIYLWLAAAVAAVSLLAALGQFINLLPWGGAAGQTTIVGRGRIDPFAGIELEARAALVFDPDRERILFAKNPDRRFPIASLTKLMTVFAARQALTEESVIQFIGRPWRFVDLTDYLLVSSSNAAAVALANTAERQTGEPLIDRMNVLARQLGLAATSFRNPTGLDLAAGLPGGESSARDITRLLVSILKQAPILLEATRHPEFEVSALDGIRYRLANTNKIAAAIPGLIASKTGYSDAARGSLAVVFNRGLNQPLVVVVLDSSEVGRFADMEKLIAAAYQYDY